MNSISKWHRRVLSSRDRVAGETDAFSQAMTFAAGPVMFGLLGRWLGNVTGTNPWMLIGGILLGIFGGSATLYYRYQARMDQLSADKPWNSVTHANTATASVNDIPDTPLDVDGYVS